MAGGGTAEGMKVSDVFILVGISILVAGFVMHAWVDSEILTSEPGEAAVLEKSVILMKNDKLLIDLDVEPIGVEVTVVFGLEEYQLMPIGDIDNLEYEFTAKEGGEHLVFIEVEGSYLEPDGVVEGEVLIDVQRSLMFDFIVYPLGALLLSFGLYKRKEEKSSKTIDAEIS